jgi:energy-coupling factor transporter ATP-binding protein EcfA2
MAYLSADPRDCLAFGSPLQVLAAACMPEQRLDPYKLAVEMEIDALLHQPIRTLSGGESVKLALAKARAISGQVSKLVLTSPFSWLSRSNRHLFDRVLAGYYRRRVPVEILALEGEDNLNPVAADSIRPAGRENVAFKLHFAGARLALGSPVNAVTDEQLWARVADFDGDLASPCLLAGGNGQGKSLLAKSLAGAIETRGDITVISRRAIGRARLLFQDAITQTLLRSFDGLIASVKGPRQERARGLFRQMRQACAGPSGQAGKLPAGGDTNRERTLMEIKLLLIAVRLADRPPALILDEPDWGLSRAAAIALVTAVISAAHTLDIPVILISHKPWWQSIAGSCLAVVRSALCGGAFEISLQLWSSR